MVEVHHLNNSRSQRILWLLEELELPYEIVKYQRDATTSLAPLKNAATIDDAARAAWRGKRLNLAIAAFRRFDAVGRAESGREARVMLVGDADFVNDQNLNREANREFAINAIRWLTGEELLIRRQGESAGQKRIMFLEPGQTTLVRMLAIVLPVGIFLAGWIVWFARRSK